MAASKPRTRIVTFRLAEEEFDRIKNQCVAQGARSISDYARTSLCNSHALPTVAGLYAQVQQLDVRVAELDLAVQEITKMLEREFGPPSRK